MNPYIQVPKTEASPLDNIIIKLIQIAAVQKAAGYTEAHIKFHLIHELITQYNKEKNI